MQQELDAHKLAALGMTQLRLHLLGQPPAGLTGFDITHFFQRHEPTLTKTLEDLIRCLLPKPEYARTDQRSSDDELCEQRMADLHATASSRLNNELIPTEVMGKLVLRKVGSPFKSGLISPTQTGFARFAALAYIDTTYSDWALSAVAREWFRREIPIEIPKIDDSEWDEVLQDATVQHILKGKRGSRRENFVERALEMALEWRWYRLRLLSAAGLKPPPGQKRPGHEVLKELQYAHTIFPEDNPNPGQRAHWEAAFPSPRTLPPPSPGEVDLNDWTQRSIEQAGIGLSLNVNGPVVHKLIDDGTVTRAGVADLEVRRDRVQTRQPFYYPSMVEAYRRGLRKPSEPLRVVIVNGEPWLQNGHHRAIADGGKLLGAELYADGTPASRAWLERHAIEGARSYKVEVLVQGETAWSSNAQRYPTKDAAETAAKDLFSRWMAVKEWRVVPTNDSPNAQAKS